ncbi:Glycosyl transferase family 4 [Musa troglodytarum]|uniref:Glycosyl transferase family 4 n=1 Tax=Musa troglodytarum TaxID=320322 RepID=A0A9E7L722_9LILI|nr:Glycosyl transferase family 4 [Musa troglodytarum]
MDGYTPKQGSDQEDYILPLLGVLFPKNRVILLGIMVLHSDGNKKDEETSPSRVLLFSSVGHGSLSILVTPCKEGVTIDLESEDYNIHPCHCVGHMAHVLRHGTLVSLRQLIRSSHQLGLRIRGGEISRFPRSPKREPRNERHSFVGTNFTGSFRRIESVSRTRFCFVRLRDQILPHRSSVIRIW